MNDWEEDYELEDWENTIIPDTMVSVENKDREQKLLEDRKKMEEADATLIKEMFTEKINNNLKTEYFFKPIIKREKSKDFERRKIELMEKQKQLSQKKREEKVQKMRLIEIYGESEIDNYDEMYGNIADKYN